MRLRLLLYALVFICAPIAKCLSQTRGPAALTGLKDIIVDYGIFLSPSLAGPDSVSLRTKLELELRKAGLRITPYSDRIDDATIRSKPMLHFTLTATLAPLGVAYTTALYLDEPAKIERLASHRFVVTWEARQMVVWSSSDTWHAEVVKSLQEHLEEFLNAYFTANPP